MAWNIARHKIAVKEPCNFCTDAFENKIRKWPLTSSIRRPDLATVALLITSSALKLSFLGHIS